ncbi:MAG: PAS domain S-box protein [Bryobacteraceae bacterium]|jgi:PAS domain S-box-containing protein
MKLILSVPAVRRYGLAVVLVAVALGIRIAIEPVAGLKWPAIVFALAVMAAARFGGLGPGLVATGASVLAVWYFLIEPVYSFAIADPSDIGGLVVFVIVGAGISVLSGQLRGSLVILGTEMAERRLAAERLAETQSRTNAILEGISDGFNTFDRQWRYTYVNAAGARLAGRTREELLGRNVWEVWPHVWDSPFGVAYRRTVEENVPLVVEAFYPEPLNAWFEVRCYPSPEGLSLFFTDTTERKRTEERLRLLESATLQTSDGILIVKVSGESVCCQDPIFANPALERMTGFGLADLREGALRLLYGPRPNPHLVEAREVGFRKACPGRSEEQIVRRDGSEFWAELSVAPIAGSNGEYTHCVWTFRDITERKRAGETARLLSSIVESSDDAILSESLDGIVLSWNRGAERIYGYTAEEIVGRPISFLRLRGAPDDYRAILGDLKHGRTIEHYEARRVRKDGRQIFVSLTVSPIRDESGTVVGGSVVARDITEQQRAREALRLSEERYRSLVLATTQTVWSTNAQGEVVDDCPQWRALTGQSFEQGRGWGWLDVVHPQDRERIRAEWLETVKRLSFYKAEYRVRRSDGQYRYMATHGVPVLEPDGTVREWIGTAADITEARLAEEEVRRLHEELESRVVERTAELEAANQELEAFAYSVSHDLRAPLRAVDGFSRILLEEYAPGLPEEARRYLEVARRNAVQMGELIDKLLAFSRLGRQPVRKQLVAPSDVARQAWEDLSAEWEGRKVEMLVGDLPLCEADPLLLKQVFVNLLSNALKYTRTREVARIELGSLRLADWKEAAAPPLAAANAEVAYTVRDNGVGFDMRYADKLFGVFQRLHRAEEYEGTGIGLANVQRLVHRHGGSVWAWADLGRGATFYFTLPGAGRRPERPAADEQEQLQA